MRHLLTAMILSTLLLTAGCKVFEPKQTATRLGPPEIWTPAAGPTALPADEADGWQRDIPDNPDKVYVKQNVYRYLKDKTERYNDYGVRRLAHGVYRPYLVRKEENPPPEYRDGKPTVVVDIYEMDLPLHAYGIFSVERNRADKMVDVGAACHIGEKEAVLWKGNHFARVTLIRDVPNAEEVLTTFAKRTAANIPGVSVVPTLAAFPAADRTPAGDSYYVKDLMGYDFLGRGFLVEYDLAGKKATMFLAIAPPTVETSQDDESIVPPLSPAVTNYVLLRRALLESGEVPDVVPGPWAHGYKATHPTLGTGLVVRRGLYIAGVFGIPDHDTAVRMTAELVRRLP